MTLMAREPFPTRVRRAGMLTLFALLFLSVAAVAVGAVVYLLQPGWSDVAAPVDAPPLPIAVAGVIFNVPPAAIRIPVQRRAGPQERIDLAYRWPDLTPPDSRTADVSARLFVTVEVAQASMPPAERLKSIYPRYIDAPATADAGGLTTAAFADDTPYQGEDVIYDASAPDRFLVRCSRAQGDLTLAMCLCERRFGAATLTFRFPRDWLTDWRAVDAGIERLIERLRPAGT
jgi:hypothetical protein